MHASNESGGSDLEFLHRLQNGDQQAWMTFHTEWTPRLYNYLRKNVPVEDIEDVTSEVMTSLVRSVKNFDGKVKLSTFVYTITNRRVADFWRKKGRAQTVELSPSMTAVTTPGPSSARLEFEEVLKRLKLEERQILLMRYREGLSVQEVADSLGTSYKAAESRLSRARKNFEKHWGQTGGND